MGTNYYNTPGYLWQGIRYLSDNYYISCGTTTDNLGVVSIGSIGSNSSSNSYIVSYPGSKITSVYGPNYIGNDIYRFVGTYILSSSDIRYGFFFEGKLSDLENSNNYKTIHNNATITYIHSTMGNLLVGNCNNGPLKTSAFLLKINTGETIDIRYPGSLTNTVYGVWYNGVNSYTLCGGYSNIDVPITDIYNDNIIKPIGSAFIVNYNIVTNTFSNWTSINYPNSTNVLTHFQGISKLNNSYQFAADTLNLRINNVGSWVDINVDLSGNFYVTKWTDIKYPLPGTITTSNSVANNVIVGLYISNGETIGYQAEITL